NKGLIDAPLAKLGEDIVVSGQGQAARTDYQVLAAAGGISCVLAKPRTGRTHQIRVHLSSVGAPILGDKKYNKTLAQNKNRGKMNLHLHAAMVQFIHPTGKGTVKIIAPPPKHIEKTFAFMEQDYESIKNHLEND
ncbi:MAG: pseudouridine synthase, partial [Alphaproteobacteria bacterium]|nr:pseudouridine synthase [Alphaproteobacteria bacterium]